ncbi:MAG TPA: hypothetical protein PKD09_04900 [Aggregatilinea sp.]|uniref:MutS-related protein n=1 Tax=Aggregatilinea sp. TaxID=2806333 RepID=UPI002C03B292|nr:hypothetical protein [Aggregatilinea sp.]HML20963.1 hypothetical protein [Aggregatilinea sp.]
MKAFLMFRDRDFDPQQELPPSVQALIQDLELDTLFNAMARDDKLLSEVAKSAVLSGTRNDLDTILYRQDILRDCLSHPSTVREIYDLAGETIASERKIYFGIIRYPSSVLRRSIEALEMFVGMLKKLRRIADDHADEFESAGFTRFFAMLHEELNDDYFDVIKGHLRELKFRGGVLVSAELGKGNKGANYTLRKQDKKYGWMERLLGAGPRAYTLHISDRDESGARALSELRDRGINLVANALAQSNDHILSFFHMLRTELAFYIGCLNLHEHLAQIGEPTTFPMPVGVRERRHSFEGLYDVCLALTMEQKIVGNDVDADYKDLVIITGANQGGKSTFLRSIGSSQLMMQCGMFVPAKAFCSNLRDGLFTHFKREEDAAMSSGKLDEELSRMSEIVDHLTSNSMLLFNESFAATNEREGSEIAGQITRALLEERIKVFFVTHLYEFAHGFYGKQLDGALFLRAERQADGERTFKMIEGEPLQTSYGGDLYSRIFETDDHPLFHREMV